MNNMSNPTINDFNTVIQQSGMIATIDKIGDRIKNNTYYVHIVNQSDNATQNAREKMPDMPLEYNNVFIYT